MRILKLEQNREEHLRIRYQRQCFNDVIMSTNFLTKQRYNNVVSVLIPKKEKSPCLVREKKKMQ